VFRQLRVLLVEDSVDDAELLLRELQRSGYDIHWQRVETADSMHSALQEAWDVIIADYAVPGFGALGALKVMQEQQLDIPFIIVSGRVGEETAVKAMKAGAHDYIMKGQWMRLLPAVEREIAEARGRRQRQLVSAKVEAQTRNLTLLNEITRAAAGVLDFDQMLQVLADRLGELLEADSCFISLWDKDKGIPIPIAAYGSLRDSYRQVSVRPGEPTITEAVLKLGQVMAIPDVLETPHLLSQRLAHKFPSRALLGLPLIAGDEKLGAALIAFNHPHNFTPEEIARGEQAAGQIAVAVAKAHFLDAEQKQRKLAETLREVTQVLTSSLEQAEVLDMLLDQLGRVMTFDSASVFRLVGDELHRRARRTVHDQTNNPILPIVKFPHIGEVFATRKPVIIEDTAVDPRWQKLPGQAFTRCWMGVPLIAHDEIIGLLNITRHQANFYNQHDAQVALAFANQAATAMENARLYERLHHYAQDLETQVAARTRELAEANEQLKELDRLKTKFVSDVSHELRTPVTNLKLYLNLLDRGDPQKQERYLSVINEQTERLEELIKSILDLSRLETNRDELLFQPVNLNELVGYAVASFKRRAELAGLIFQVDLASSLPLIYGNPSQLKQVIENLLTNAIHYTAAGEVLVSTYYDAEHGMVCLQVTDTGMGIDESELSLLFERFYRGERTSQSNIPGTGLGLSIVKEILALHNGRIEVQSELHQGSTFRVWLPISNQ
jgi:signal transduction histidine kinase/DNA-binding response OmpR family regulator